MSNRGRPSKLTPARADRLIQALRLGYPYASAAAYVGIHRDTLQNWRRRGAEALETATQDDNIDPLEPGAYQAEHPDEQPYLDFFVASTRARAEAEGFYLSTLRKIADEGDDSDRVRAATFMLERSFGYHRRDNLSLTGADDGPVEIELRFADERDSEGVDEL